MRNFIQFLVKYHIFLFFLVLQDLCFWLILRNNTFHEASFVNSSNRVVGTLLSYKSNLSVYIELQRVNDELSAENEELRNMLTGTFVNVNDHFVMINDTLRERKYRYKSAQVINSSINKQLNYLTINKGLQEGLSPGMGVINTNGLVGVVKDVSEHFSTVIPIINLSFTASAELERTGSFGLLRWDGKNHRYAMLNDIPGHVDVREGDTLVTRSASGIYPRGIQIGTVEEVEQKDGSNFHQIKVLLNNDFGQLRYVYVVDNLLRAEQELIESNTATNVQ
jgi:rod shape-determining protein MreC